MANFGELLEAIRARHDNPGARRLAYDPVFFDREPVMAAIDLFERLAVTGTKLDPLQALAVEMLIADFHRR